MGTVLTRAVLMASIGLALAAATAPAVVICDGDCDGDRRVTVDELIRGVAIALGGASLATCTSVDAGGDGEVMIDEVIGGLGRALEGCPPPFPRDATLRLNHLQVLGTHNSYHVEAAPPLLDAIADFSADLAVTLQYGHAPLSEQFQAQGVRQIELDVFADPMGGLYARPVGLELVTGDPEARIPELDVSGFKVLHVQDIDYDSTCRTFVDCLRAVRAWSEAHPWHAPLMILVEAKDDVLPDLGLDFVVPIPIGDAELDAIEGEIRSVFPPGQVLTPDEVRGARATLREAIEQDGWPTLAATRGRVLFCLDNEGGVRAAYLDGHPSLRGRVMFTSARPPADDAAFVKLNDPLGDLALIQELVGQGYLVRTRADADTRQARSGDTAQRDAALASGAQFVSTDYPVPDPRFGTGYMVAIPGGMPGRCNPISAPAACAAPDIE